jgi:uncharacterized membrane protein
MRLDRLRLVHQFLTRYSLYPMLFSTVLGFCLVAARVILSGTHAYVGLAWNLVLAWVPYLASLWAARLHRTWPGRWWMLLFPCALWLVFFPNAPYILTDFWHLTSRHPIPVWFDIGLLSLFALTGLFLGLLSLRLIQRIVEHYVGLLLGWVFVLIALGLCALGVYVGRFLRWNSWDLLLNPRAILADVANRLANPLDYAQSYGVILLLGAILLVCYWTFASREGA